MLVLKYAGLPAFHDFFEIVYLDDDNPAHRVEDRTHGVQEGDRLGEMIESVGQENSLCGLEFGRNPIDRVVPEQALHNGHVDLLRNSRKVRGRLNPEYLGSQALEIMQLLSVPRSYFNHPVRRPYSKP